MPSSPDKYDSFAALARAEKPGEDFLVRYQDKPGMPLVLAPHGGGIEPGTSELAEAIAGPAFSFYIFEGLKRAGNGVLHITSTRFDEPRALSLVKPAPFVLALHGEESAGETVFLGGRDEALALALRGSLTQAGFAVEIHPNLGLQGLDAANICNRGVTGRGVQLELSRGLRSGFFKSLSREGRQTRTQSFERFVAAVREGILQEMARGAAPPL